MKKWFLILVLICGLVVAGAAVFIATFDADRYRPLVVTQLQRALGKPVQLQRLSLGWRNGLAVQLQGLAIADDAQAQREPLAQIDSVSAVVRLLPLLHKDVQVASIVVRRPRIHVTRDANGRINLLGLAAVAGPAAAPSRSTEVGGTPVSFNIASLIITDGAVHWSDAMVPPPPAELWLNAIEVKLTNIASSRPMDLDAKTALGSTTQNLHLVGRVTLPRSTAVQPSHPGATTQGSIEQLTVTTENLSLEHILPAVASGLPQLHGHLTLTLQGSVPTLDPAQIARMISVTGRLRLTEGKIVNFNLLRAVFEKLSMLPELEQRLEAKLPETYRRQLTAADTLLTPLDASARVDGGTLRFDELHVGTDTCQLAGTGTVQVDGTLRVQARLRIERELSAAIMQSVHELQALASSTGEIEMPVTIQGKAPQLAIVPDLKYVTSKVVATTAADLLTRLLDKQKDVAPPPAGTETAQPADLLGQLLQRALQKNAPKSQQ